MEQSKISINEFGQLEVQEGPTTYIIVGGSSTIFGNSFIVTPKYI